MQHLRANTQVIVTVGPFVDVGDGFTPQTDITLGGNEAELIKHGLTAVVDISGATWAAVTSCRGYYSLTLTTSHTDTEGMLVVVVQDDSDTLPVKQEYMVLSEAAYDSLYVAKDAGFMDVNIKTIGRADTQETEADKLELACAAYAVTTGLAGTALPAAAAGAPGGIPLSTAGSLEMDTLADWVNAGRLDAILDKIPLSDGTVTWNATALGSINTQAGTALSDINLDHLMKLPVQDADVVDDSALAMLVSKAATAGWDDYEHTTDSLQAQRDNIGTLGAAMTDLGGMSTTMKGQVNTEVDGSLAT